METGIENDWKSGPGLQFHRKRLKGQTDDIGVRAGNAFDELIAFFLNGVPASFVQGIHAGEIAADFDGIERTKSDGGAFAKDALTMIAQKHQANRRDDLMSAALKFFEHFIGLLKRGWFAKKCRFQTYECIRAEDEGVRVFLGHRPRFAISIDLRGFADAELIVMDFCHRARNNFEIERQLAQQLRASRRG